MNTILDFLSWLEGVSPVFFNIVSWALVIMVFYIYHKLFGRAYMSSPNDPQ